jgi:hypothetical protein
MPDWLVITADRTGMGRGVRGYTLAWFLQTYFGKRNVAIATPDDLRRAPLAADTAFLGLPTSLTAEQITLLLGRGRYRRLAAFDYLDQHELAWTAEQETALRPLTNHYFKPWFEQAWSYNLRMAMLPIRHYRRFTSGIAVDRLLRRFAGPPNFHYDIAFLGRPNRTRIMVDGRIRKIDQRVHWLREIKRMDPSPRLWGGLSDMKHTEFDEIVNECGDISELFYSGGKVTYPEYFSALRHSRVLLAPGGNVPWSYRHYECLYAGGVAVTIDFRQRDMLVPLPRENMIHVPDDGSVVPAIEQALELSRRRPNLGEENVRHLEQYLSFGGYSAKRPALIERFVKQLD